MARTLEQRHNNAYNTILLIEDGEVIGAWTVGGRDNAMTCFNNPGDLADWEPTSPEDTDPADYGELVDSK
jgi:hypothetical protein